MLRALRWTALLLLLAPATARAQDDHGDTPAAATALTPGASREGAFERAGDEDWFAIRTAPGTRISVFTSRLTQGTDTVLTLCDAAGAALAEDDDGGPEPLASRVELVAPAGTLTVRVRHYDPNATGRYALTAVAASPAGDALALEAAALFDPKLAGAELSVRSRIAGSGQVNVDVRVEDAGGATVRPLASGVLRQAGRDYQDVWDGRDLQGRFVAPGSYQVHLRAVSGSAVQERRLSFSVVRLGVTSIRWDDPGDDSRVPLVFHEANPQVAGSTLPLDALGPAWTLPLSPLGQGGLDAGDGSPLPIPGPWRYLAVPPRDSSGAPLLQGHNLPVAYRLGARPRLVLELGRWAGSAGGRVACGYPVSGRALRLRCGGAVSGPLQPGDRVTLDLPALEGGVTRRAYDLRLSFEYADGGAWLPVPGDWRAEVTVYQVLARPTATAQAWVAALDQVTSWSDGTIREPRALLDAITRGVWSTLRLRYDDRLGASAYSEEGYEFDLSAFLGDRRYGTVINCSDCANAVASLANQAGIRTWALELAADFSLHWIRGIGHPAFTDRLFGGVHAFSYHAVVSMDGAATIHDACLEVDDDSQPWRSPFQPRLPLGMPYARYLEQLSPDARRTVGLFNPHPLIGVRTSGTVQVR